MSKTRYGSRFRAARRRRGPPLAMLSGLQIPRSDVSNPQLFARVKEKKYKVSRGGRPRSWRRRSGGSTRWHFLIGGGFPVVTGGFPVVTWGSTSRFFAPPNSWQQHHKYNNRRRFSREPHRPNFAGVECAAHQHRPAPAQATCRGEPACGPFDATNDMIKLRCLPLRAQLRMARPSPTPCRVCYRLCVL